jgi:hypothetical protein
MNVAHWRRAGLRRRVLLQPLQSAFRLADEARARRGGRPAVASRAHACPMADDPLEPGISIVIPKRANPTLLGDCLRSAVAACRFVSEPTEIIMVVDGSPRWPGGEKRASSQSPPRSSSRTPHGAMRRRAGRACAWRTDCTTSKTWHRHRASVAKLHAAAEIDRIFARNRTLFHLRNLDRRIDREALFEAILAIDRRSFLELAHPRQVLGVLRARVELAEGGIVDLKEADLADLHALHPVGGRIEHWTDAVERVDRMGSHSHPLLRDMVHKRIAGDPPAVVLIEDVELAALAARGKAGIP